jgi:predicted N-formylglutamate amidohydrolase
MEPARQHVADEAVQFVNRQGASPYVLVCEHASNAVPARFGALGLDAAELSRHIAWDPGALPVAERMALSLDAVLVRSCLSRLVIDCNRPLDAPDLVPAISEATVVPGNAGLSAVEREQRIALSWRPFHAALEAVIAERIARRQETRLVSIHSFTPVYHGRSRPWQIGIIHDEDRRLAGPLIEALQRMEELRVGVNEPYSPADRVYFTHERHARPRGLACAMIEIRNDEIADEDGQRRWADLLGGILSRIRPAAADEPLPARSRRV